jgi:hypothetical protein
MFKRRCNRAVVFGLVFAVLFAPSPAIAADPDAVDKAIAKGVEFLSGRKNFVEKGHWEDVDKRGEGKDGPSITGPQWGGRTALCTYAILASGVSPNDPKVKRPIEFLRKADIIGYYALGLRSQVWLFVPSTPENRDAVVRDFKLLWAGVEKDPSKKDVGLYDYTLQDRIRIDLSVSQYGVLGMWACAQLNMEVPSGDLKKNQPNYWGLVERQWKSLQDRGSGGWAYQGGGDVSPAMTAAGVATLYITQEYLHTRDGITCSGNITYPELDKGIDYLAKALPAMLAPGGDADHYTLYGIERIGVASGLKFLDDVDWYRAGADFLVRTQRANGSWSDRNGEEVSTAFAILFLSRGREPVMANKMRYDLHPTPTTKVEGFWNERARDIANATRFVTRQLERQLNWQILDLSICTVDDLHDAPIAYFSGAQALKFSDDQKAKLKQYVEEGGMLVFNTDCGRRPFGTSVTKLLGELFPRYEPRALEADSVILKNQQFKSTNWKQKPDVKAVSNGVREIALIFDDDAAKSWQTNEYTVRNDHFALMADVYQYAIDKVHANVKGRTHVVRENGTIKADKPPIKVARLLIKNANTDPEPGGWRRLTSIFRNTLKTPLVVTNVDPEVDDLNGYHVAHLTGVGPVQLKPAAIANLKKFVAAGGVLVIDAAGGDQKFVASVGGQLHNIVDAATSEGGDLLESSDPLYKIDAGSPLKVEYRVFRKAVGDAASLPSLHATKVGGRYGIIFSTDDLSAGLVGNEVDGIRGYTPSTATALMTRILLYAKDAKTGLATPTLPKPASAPATVPSTRPVR